METIEQSVRNGWKTEETELLWKEITAAAENGEPLRGVFERMGRQLGRKPNSVRNYYYMQLRSRGGEELRLAAPFDTFTEEEIHSLIRSVLTAKGCGQSVRACVMALSGGDKARMLRYQNKYRSVLRKRPELIHSVCRELETEGIPYADPLLEQENRMREGTINGEDTDNAVQDPDVRLILEGVKHLLERAQPGVREGDRLRVQRDLLLMQLEDVQAAAKDMIAECKEFLGLSAAKREGELESFGEKLSMRVAKLESVSG